MDIIVHHNPVKCDSNATVYRPPVAFDPVFGRFPGKTMRLEFSPPVALPVALLKTGGFLRKTMRLGSVALDTQSCRFQMRLRAVASFGPETSRFLEIFPECDRERHFQSHSFIEKSPKNICKCDWGVVFYAPEISQILGYIVVMCVTFRLARVYARVRAIPCKPTEVKNE